MDVQLFRVTTDNRGCEIWAAATSSEEAFSRILDARDGARPSWTRG
jgi:hypothetical protein